MKTEKREMIPVSRRKIFFFSLILFFILMLCSSPVSGTGSKTSVGDSILKTDQLRTLTGGDGSGISVGVISNGVKHRADAQKTGDLPDVHVLKEGQMDEGTAMLEIIHDIAPNSTLYYNDFGGSEERFNKAVDDLIASGCQIIVDDVGYLEVPYFEDGPIAKHLIGVMKTHPDIIYVTAAGNYADVHYQSDYKDGGNGYHSFNGSSGIPFEAQTGGSMTIILQWDDQFTNPGNSYSLELYDTKSNALLAVSERSQGTKSSLEKLQYQNLGDSPVTGEIRVKKGENTKPGLIKMLIIAEKDKIRIQDGYLTPEESIIGQPSVPGVISVAAISPSKIIEKFSSQGAVEIKYPVIEERKKPDITAIDGVDITGAGGFPTPFTGTSAAAPHIAGLFALEWSILPNMSATQLTGTLFRTSHDLGEPGWDPVYGYGLPDALQMYEFLKNSTPEGSTHPGGQETTTDTTGPIDANGIISGPCVITKPGTYQLGGDIRDPAENIILITSSDVTLDGADHTIEGIAVRFGVEPPVMQSGIRIWSPEGKSLKNIIIRNCTVIGTYMAISGTNTEELTIGGCSLRYNTQGISIRNSTHVMIQNSVLEWNGYGGVVISGSVENVLLQNSFRNNLYGLVVTGGSGTSIQENEIVNNHKEGIMISAGATGNTIDKNVCSGNKNGGIGLYSSLKNLISNNTADTNDPFGILLHESSENSIRDNILTGNTRGVNIYYSDGNTLKNNTIYSNRVTGIMFQPSGHNVLTDNRIFGNAAEGILVTSIVDRSQQNMITDNYLENEQNVRIQEGGSPNYAWNQKKTQGTNIAGGPYLGGNVWAQSDLKGYSQICSDAEGDGICDQAYEPLPGVVDQLPLRYTGPVSGAPTPEITEPKTAEDWITTGKNLMGKSDYESAIKAFEKAIELSPTSYQPWRDKSLCLSKLKRFDDAIATIDAILNVYPDSAELWSTKGDIYLVDLEQYQDSIQYYEKAVSLDDKNIHSMMNLAYALDKTGKSEQALELYRKVTTINPSLVDAWNKAGNIQARASKYFDAITMYDKALDLDPGNAYVWNNKGYALAHSGQQEDAISAYLKAIAIDKSYTTAWKNLGDSYRALGRNIEADEAYSHT